VSKIIRLPGFDNLELFTCDSSLREYPPHYHDTFCLSILRKGMLKENTASATGRSLMIAHPLEVHQNQLIANTPYSMTTFYVSADVLCSLSKSKYVSFPKTIHDNELFASFYKLSATLLFSPHPAGNAQAYQQAFATVLNRLISGYASAQPYEIVTNPELLEIVKQYMLDHLYRKITIDELAKIAGQRKFKFLRWFKQHTGLTPYSFILLNRIQQAKKMIGEGKSLVHAALDSGFYDQSHFSHYFKYFTGATPGAYQKGCNIFQYHCK
jgi:AraC-like DNA-binding protein